MKYTRKIFMLPMPEKVFRNDGKGNAGWTTALGPEFIRTVDMFEADGVGLGYYIDPSNGERKSSQELRGGRDWYATVHLASGKPIHVLYFYCEEDVQAFIEQISVLVDWTKPLEELVLLPNWPPLSRVREIAQSITADFLELVSTS